MKKNLFMSMLAMAGMLFATSCSQDELLNEPTTGDYVNAKFTIGTIDGIATRATIGNGEKADVVTCAVFDKNGKEMTLLRQTISISQKQATYDIRLVKGQEYRVAFFAYNENAAAYDVTDMTNIKINGKQACNIENRDAFTAYTIVTAEESMNAINRNVTLYRPFAQLNLGAYKKDIEAAANAGVTVTNSQIKVSNVYTAFNAYENVVAGETSEVTFAMNGIPTEDLEVDINGDENIGDDEKFEYLALNYLLVGDADTEKSLTDVEFVWMTADGKTNNPTTVFKNIPVQRNYRTNIIGYLLTNPAQFNIFIDEKFEKPDYIVTGPWDGVSVMEPSKNSEGAYMVATPEEWAWLANKTFAENTTVEILGNIDMNGGDFMMTMNAKELIINGNGFAISNINAVKSTSGNNNGDAASVSLFYPRYADSKLVINDLTFENVKAHNESLNTNNGHNAAVIASYNEGQIELNNVRVNKADVKAMEGVGVLVGITLANSKVTINNCSVNDSKVSNLAVENESGYVAAMVGKVAAATVTFTGENSINNTTINAYYASNRGETSIDWVAVKRVETATITGADAVAVSGGSMTKIPLEQAANVADNSELTTAIQGGNTYITLNEGTYTLPNAAAGKTLTISGTKDAKISVTSGLSYANGATVTFEGVTIQSDPEGAGYTNGFADFKYATFNNCVVAGTLGLDFSCEFNNCEFDIEGDFYSVWTWGAGTATFKGCTFNCDGKALLVYPNVLDNGTSHHIVNITDCVFNDNGDDTITGKAAIEITDTYPNNNLTFEVNITNTTVNGFSVTTQNATTYGGTNLGTNVWGNKNLLTADDLDVIIDGTEVY